MTYKISTEQARLTGNILGVAVVERLDHIVELLSAIGTSQAEAIGHARRLIEAPAAPLGGYPTNTPDLEEHQ